jgi:predicted metal-dependent hydrolase
MPDMIASDMLRQLQLWDLGGIEQNWSVRQSARARRLSVRVFRNGGVEIVVPPRTSPHRVSAFVSEHREWIERQRRRSVPQVDWPLPPTELSLSAIGQQWRCTEAPAAGRLRTRELDGCELQLKGVSRDREHTRQVILRWLVKHAALCFEAPLRKLAAQMGLKAGKLQIRCQRTRWGSCSRKGTISLNVCLLFQRPEVLRYLMIHELSHLRHMNHSSRFWAELARHEPDWKTLDRELQQGWRRVPTWVFR